MLRINFLLLASLCLSGFPVLEATAEDRPVASSMANTNIRPPAKKPMPSSQQQWLDLPQARRRTILEDWQKLPQDTRPPFITYRDTVCCGKQVKNAQTVKNPNKGNAGKLLHPPPAKK